MLTEHAVLEVDGQNVVGMKDKDIGKVIEDAPATVTITIMPGTKKPVGSRFITDYVYISRQQTRF